MQFPRSGVLKRPGYVETYAEDPVNNHCNVGNIYHDYVPLNDALWRQAVKLGKVMHIVSRPVDSVHDRNFYHVLHKHSHYLEDVVPKHTFHNSMSMVPEAHLTQICYVEKFIGHEATAD